MRCVSEGNGVRATARMLSLNKDRVNNVILKAGKYAETVMSNLLKNLHLNECQMDELWSFINKKKR
jgi:transposase-like protein